MKYASLRLPDILYAAINQTAENNRRSMHAEILRALEFYLKNAPEAHYSRIDEPRTDDKRNGDG